VVAIPDIRGLMEAHARRASRESTRMYRDLATANRARSTPIRLMRAQNALATPGIRDLMEAHALRATKAHTRMRQDPAAATTALHTPTRHLEAS